MALFRGYNKGIKMDFKHAKCVAASCLVGTLITPGIAQCQETMLTAQLGTQTSPQHLAQASQQSDAPAPSSSIEQIRQELESQTKALAAQQRLLEEQERKLATQKRELMEALRRMETLQAQLAGEAPRVNAPVKTAQADPSPAQPVGQRPTEVSPPPVAPIFEQPGILTQRGKLVLEPSLSYSYSSTYRVSLVGYTIIPALTIGLIDIRGVNDSTWIGAMTARYGITNRLEIEAKVPYVYRTEAAITRPVATPSSGDSVFNSDGKGLGDVEVSARYQLNESTGNNPYYIAGLRIKARNGKDPFSIPSTTVSGAQLPSELPTGSGFWAIQPSLSVIYPTDPAVFFGGANISWNIDRDVGGGRGKVHPGNAMGMNFGMGLALNEKASFSVGYEHTWVGKPSASGGSLLFPAATTTQLSSLLFGYAYRLNNTTSINASVGAGLTRDTPDVQVMLRIPITL